VIDQCNLLLDTANPRGMAARAVVGAMDDDGADRVHDVGRCGFREV
jgi:hypothetical protein